VALIHSPRAGRRFAELVDRASIARGGVTIAAISPAAAEAAGEGWARVEAAERPADDVLLALAARLCNKPPPQ
jgi:uroporphyrinogen-III synthase